MSASESLEARLMLRQYDFVSTFGDDGVAIAEFGDFIEFSAQLVAEVDNDKILVVGQVQLDFDGNQRLVLARFNGGDGSLDTSFNGDGRLLSFPVGAVMDAAMQDDGKVVVIGLETGTGDTFVARFNSDGTFDATFAGDGIAEIDLDDQSGNSFSQHKLAIADDGKIVFVVSRVGQINQQLLLVRLTSTGTPDITFGGDGVADFVNAAIPHQIALQDDGRILVVGEHAPDTFIRRFTAAGAPDTSFSGDGLAAFPEFDTESITSVGLQSDGKILIDAGAQAVARLTTSGALDSTFAGDGTATLTGDVLSTNSEFFIADITGQITLLNLFGVWRLNADGSPDSDFGISGLINNSNLRPTEVDPTTSTFAANGDVLLAGNSPQPAALAVGRFAPCPDAFLDQDGVLRIAGSKDDDTISVARGSQQVTVDRNGAQTNFPAAQVVHIVIETGSGNDTITSSGGSIIIYSGEGDDSVTNGDADDFIDLGPGSNALFSGGGADHVFGGDGNDSVDTGDGDDTIFGLGGNDSLAGGDGDDYLQTREGDDTLLGGAGNDRLHGGDGSNVIFAGAGNDLLKSGEGNDSLWGESGYDTLRAGPGNDFLHGGNGKDKMWGQQGNDRLYGSGNNDAMDGGPGNDLLEGRDGDDKLFDRDGVRDTLDGDGGLDQAHADDLLDLLTDVETVFP